jgi:hypothetical protein
LSRTFWRNSPKQVHRSAKDKKNGTVLPKTNEVEGDEQRRFLASLDRWWRA